MKVLLLKFNDRWMMDELVGNNDVRLLGRPMRLIGILV